VDKRIDTVVSETGVSRAYNELVADMDRIVSATIRFGSPETDGPYWVVIDFLARKWTVWSDQHGLVGNRETRVNGEFETFRDIQDLLYMFTDGCAHERLKVLARAVYGRRSFM
jgi:hypothetical protein